MTAAIRYWAVVPAAGLGSRMRASTPKQYLALEGRPIIEHTLARLLGRPRIAAVMVAIASEDRWWPTLDIAADPRIERAAGGAQRCHSVLNALERLAERAAPEDRVLVHDAVRPCVRAADVERLIDEVGSSESGGLLALPVRDTMKRSNEGDEVVETVSRDALWHALTPQLFPLGALREALLAALAGGRQVTDEAAAMEAMGARPRLIEGHADNIKITRPEDLRLAALYLAAQEREA